MKTNSTHDQTSREHTNDTIEAVAVAIFEMLGDHQAAAAAIGEQVARVIRWASPRAARVRVRNLAAMLNFPARELIRCHQAYVVAKLAGEGLGVRLSLGAPLDLYVQFFRIARADGDMEWKKDAILRIAEEVGRGLPEYLAGGKVDAALAAKHGRRPIGASEWGHRPDVGPAVVVEEEEAA